MASFSVSEPVPDRSPETPPADLYSGRAASTSAVPARGEKPTIDAIAATERSERDFRTRDSLERGFVARRVRPEVEAFVKIERGAGRRCGSLDKGRVRKGLRRSEPGDRPKPRSRFGGRHARRHGP